MLESWEKIGWAMDVTGVIWSGMAVTWWGARSEIDVSGVRSTEMERMRISKKGIIWMRRSRIRSERSYEARVRFSKREGIGWGAVGSGKISLEWQEYLEKELDEE